MQFLSIAACFFSLSILSPLVASQGSTAPIPSATIGTCADNCLMSGAQDSGCGSFQQSSFGCLCKAGSTFPNSTTTCIQTTCQGADLAETEFIIRQVCAQASSGGPATSSTVTPTRPAGGSAITTEATGTPGGTDSSISLLPTSSFSFTGSGIPTPIPISGTQITSGSSSGTDSSSVAASSTGAALGRTTLTVHQTVWIPLFITIAGILSGACYILF